MSLNFAVLRKFVVCITATGLLSSCFHPPYNDFQPVPVHPLPGSIAKGAAVGTVVGAALTGTLPGALVGTAIGGGVGTVAGLNKTSKRHIIKQLMQENIEFVQYGDTMTLIIPTDKYFMFESPRINEILYPGLINSVRLIKMYPLSPVYVAAFTDNVGNARHKRRLSQAQAETIMTFLWANHIPAELLKAEGYADKNDVGDNKSIHGSAFNRRIEIQWFSSLGTRTCPICTHRPVQSAAVMYPTK